MSRNTAIERYLARVPYAATIGYGAMLATFAWIAWGAVANVVEQRAMVATTADILRQLEGRSAPGSQQVSASDVSVSTGSAFLEGSTVTVAGAALLQRVAGAVTRVGGNILSSQVELQGIQSKAGFVSVVVSCEVEEPKLQQLLYDIEAGMPFIFVDQLVVQAPVAASATQGGKMRVLLGVSSQWQGAK